MSIKTKSNADTLIHAIYDRIDVLEDKLRDAYRSTDDLLNDIDGRVSQLEDILYAAENTIEEIAHSDDHEEAVALAEQYMVKWTKEKK